MGITLEAAYTTLTLDGNLDLVDNVNYSLVEGGWSPAVAARRVSVLTNRSPYEDVTEEIVVNVYGTTAAVALENLHKLSAALDRAERWSAGENVNPVLLTVQPQGSALADPLAALVLGRAGNAPLLGLPVTFNDKLMVWTIEDVRLRFRRRGQWLGAAVTTTAVAANVPGPFSVSFASLPATRLPAALTVKLDGIQELPTGTFPASTLLVTGDSATALQFVEGESFGGASWSVVADAANLPRVSVGRFTSSGTALVESGATLSSTMEAGPIGIWGVLRSNTSASASWRIAVELEQANTTRSIGITRETFIPADGNVQPRVVYLGSIYAANSTQVVRLHITPGASGATLDFDYLVLLNLRDASSAAINIDADPGTTGFTIAELTVDSRALTAVAPRVYARLDGFSTTYTIGARGPLWLSDNPSHATYYVAWLATNGTKWRLDNGAGTVVNLSLSVDRRPTYLVPQ